MQAKINPWDIPGFKYRHLVKKVIAPLQVDPNFAACALGIILRSGKRAWVSSIPKITVRAVHAGFDRAELLLQYDFVKEPRVIFPSEYINYDMAQTRNNCLRDSTGYTRAYAVCYTCDDCAVLLSYTTKTKAVDEKKVYADTIDRLIAVGLDLLDKLMPMFVAQLPELTASRFATDAAYREQVLRVHTPKVMMEPLSKQEIAILYWSARGKTAEEIGVILSLSKNTVDTYRRRLIEKMGVTNITQAVYLALSAQLIT